MANGDFQDLYEGACYRSRRDPSDTTYDVPRAKAAVLEVLESVYSSGDDWDFLLEEGNFTATVSDGDYTFADLEDTLLPLNPTTKEIIELYDLVVDTAGQSRGALEQVDWDDLENIALSTADGDADGCPRYWAQWNRNLRLYPKPDQAYTIRCFLSALPAELSAAGDLPAIPRPWRRRLIIPGAAAILLREEGGMEAQNEADKLEALFSTRFIDFRTAHSGARGKTLSLIDPSWTRNDYSNDTQIYGYPGYW